jgi:serine/threonine-protein kinase
MTTGPHDAVGSALALQHPHILPLLDSGDARHPERSEGSAFLYYVMPLATGETLRDRLTRERQLPIDDTLRRAANSPI